MLVAKGGVINGIIAMAQLDRDTLAAMAQLDKRLAIVETEISALLNRRQNQRIGDTP